MSSRANGVMHIRIAGISVSAVSRITIDHGTDPPGEPAICSGTAPTPGEARGSVRGSTLGVAVKGPPFGAAVVVVGCAAAAATTGAAVAAAGAWAADAAAFACAFANGADTST